MSTHSSHSLEKGDDKPETDRDPLPHYYNPMATPDTSFFYTSREGRFVFPFEEGEQKQLVSLDEGVEAKLPPIADKIELIARRVWREFFAALKIAFTFLFIFLLELTRFVAHDIVHALVLRLLTTIGDFIVKPFLVTLFNNFILPILVFIWNVLSAVNSMIQPAVNIVKSFALQIALVLKAFRLVDVTYHKSDREANKVQQV